MALLVGIVGSGLAAMLVPMAVVQIHSTTFDNSRTREMNAAEAGISVALGQIRGAGTVIADLPCTATPIAGTVAGADVAGPSASPGYRVQIDYYQSDPTGEPDSWLDINAVTCTAGSGPSMTKVVPAQGVTPSYVPAWAVVTATGYDNRGERTLRAVYTFVSPATTAGVSEFAEIGTSVPVS